MLVNFAPTMEEDPLGPIWDLWLYINTSKFKHEGKGEKDQFDIHYVLVYN